MTAKCYTETYRTFSHYQKCGLRKKANKVAQQLVSEYAADPAPGFVVAVCDAVEHKLNHHLWAGLALPYTRAGLETDPAAAKCLIQTIQNLYPDRAAHRSLDWITEEQLTLRYLTMSPGDVWALNRRKQQLARWLWHAIHEWPAGVLFGMDGATEDECAEILEAVSDLRSIDDQQEYMTLCDEVENKVLQYRKKLRAQNSPRV